MNRSSARTRMFWTRMLDGGARTPLPRWYPPGSSTSPGRETRVHPIAGSALISAAEELGVELDTVLLAVHAKVLAAATGEPHVVFGYRVDELDALPCAVTVPDGSWAELVRTVAELRERMHAHLPTSVAELELPTDRELFDSVVDSIDARGDVADAAWQLAVDVEHDALRVSFRADRFPADQVDRLGGYHRRALRALAADPHAPHADTTLVSEDEHRQQIDGLAGPERPLPDARVHELFEQRVRQHPETVAAVHGGQRWTYRQLNERANEIAHTLLARGLRSEDVVAVVTDRTLDWMASVLAVFKAGGCYLPVEPDFPADRVGRTLRRSECRFALAESGRTATLAEADHPAEVLVLADVAGTTTDPGVRVAADQLAYVYFTSGSTGEPKGAMCEHAGMLNHVLAKIEDLGIAEGTVVAETAPQCFDISLWQLVSALLVGGRTVIVGQEVILDVRRFVETVTAERVEVLQLVPSYLETVLSYLDEHPRPLTDVRCVSATGEALKKELVQRWFASYPGIALVNAYGLTETSDDTNHEVMTTVPAREGVPLGPPVRNTRVYIVDERLRPVPLGAPGEIVFSGVCVGRGYINDPDRTAAAFGTDPHRPGARLYRSGDFGRWLPEGTVEFLGRRDAQIKIRGFRIEIGEIENRLLRAPGVRDGAVVVAEDAAGHQHLVAFYAADAPVPDAEFRAFLRESLPHYMVPDHLHHRAALPLTANGKIDKKTLIGWAAEHSTSKAAHPSPRTATERRLAEQWAEVLSVPVDTIGRDDHFFERGGTSLSAVKLIIKLGREVSLRELTGHPVLAELAHVLDERSRTTTRSAPLGAAFTDGGGKRALLDQHHRQHGVDRHEVASYRLSTHTAEPARDTHPAQVSSDR